MRKLIVLLFSMTLAIFFSNCIQENKPVPEKSVELPPEITPNTNNSKLKAKILAINGDRLEIEYDNETSTFRLAVKIPESRITPYDFDNITDVGCLERWREEVSEILKRWEGKECTIEFESLANNSSKLIYVYCNNTTAELVKKGLAALYDAEYSKKEYYVYQMEAMRKRSGLWSCIKGEKEKTIKEPIGGFLRKTSLWLRPGDSETLPFVLYSMDYRGKVSFHVSMINGSTKLPEGVEIRLEPSSLNVTPNSTYEINVTVNSTKTKYNWSENVIGNFYTFLIKAEIGKQTIEDRLMVLISAEGRSVAAYPISITLPKISEVRAEVGKAKVISYTLQSNSAMGKAKIKAYPIDKTGKRVTYKGMKVYAKPEEFYFAKWREYNIDVVVKTTPDFPPGRYAIEIVTEFEDFSGKDLYQTKGEIRSKVVLNLMQP